MGIGHSEGFSSIVIPGSGEPNIDTYTENPFETRKQQRETEVKQLLEKIQPDMITMNPDFHGQISRDANEEQVRLRKLANEANFKETKEKNERRKT